MKRALILAAAVCFLGGVASAVTVVIDNFESGTPALAVTVDGNTVTVTETTPPLTAGDVRGGNRKTTLTRVPGVTGDGPRVSADIFAYGGDKALACASDPNVSGIWDLQYGLMAGGAAMGNLKPDPSTDAIVFIFLTADAGASVTMSVKNGDPAWVSTTKNTTGAGTLVYPFTDFPGIDFTNIESMEFNITGLVNGDYTISLLQTQSSQEIPEPLSMAGVLLGIGGLAGYIRRRR